MEMVEASLSNTVAKIADSPEVENHWRHPIAGRKGLLRIIQAFYSIRAWWIPQCLVTELLRDGDYFIYCHGGIRDETERRLYIDLAIGRYSTAYTRRHRIPRTSQLNLLYRLAYALDARYHQALQPQFSDIDHSVQLIVLSNQMALGSGLDVSVLAHPDHYQLLARLGRCLIDQFTKNSQLGFLKIAAELLEDAGSLAGSSLDPHAADEPLVNLARANRCWFMLTGDVTRLEISIQIGYTCLEAISEENSDRTVVLNNLANALYERYDYFGDLADLETAIQKQKEAMDSRPKGHPLRLTGLNTYAILLAARYTRLGDPQDLDLARAYSLEASNLMIGERPLRITSAGQVIGENKYLTRNHSFDYSSFARAANSICCSQNNEAHLAEVDNPLLLSNLGDSLRESALESFNIPDLDEAILLIMAAANQTPVTSVDYPYRLSSLIGCLCDRHALSVLPQASDLDAAISLGRDCVSNLYKRQPLRITILIQLASALERRSHYADLQTHAGPDILNEACAYVLEVLNLTEVNTRAKIDAHKVHAWLLLRLNALNNNQQLLEEAANIYREVIASSPPTSPSHLMDILNFCEILLKIWDTEEPTEVSLTDGIQLLIKSLPSKDHFIPTSFYFHHLLSKFYLMRFNKFLVDTDLEACISHAQTALANQTSPPNYRFGLALEVCQFCCEAQMYAPALWLVEAALYALSQLAPASLDIPSRHKQLAKYAQMLGPRAAAIALRLKDPEKSLELLENSRSHVWAQILHLRSPIDSLRLVAPALADRLIQCTGILNAGAFQPTVQVIPKALQRTIESEYAAQAYRRSEERWRSTVDEVRLLPGFADFMRPPRYENLSRVSEFGIVVVVNVCEMQSDMIMIRAGGARAVSLPRDMDAVMKRYATKLRKILVGAGLQGRSAEDPSSQRDMVTDSSSTGVEQVLQEYLNYLWATVCKPLITSLRLQATDSPERLIWCPTGRATLVPLFHAAGDYSANPTQSLSQYAISSYVPTLASILKYVEPQTTPPMPKPKILAIAQPHTPHQSSLPATIDETSRLAKLVEQTHSKELDFSYLSDSDATTQRVSTEILGANILHAACHGAQDATDPLSSGLLLHDGRLDLRRIIGMNIPHGALAFLSACQTATGEATLADESVSIAAGLLFAGFRGVVGTLWGISDRDMPEATETFYKILFAEKGLDLTNAATALHHAVQKMRANGLPVRRWAPFIFMGV